MTRRKIAYLCLGWIGDALMQTPSIKIIKEKYPDCRLDVITMSWAIKFIIDNSGLCDNAFVFDPMSSPLKEFYRLVKFWMKEKYDVSILGFPSYRKEYHIFHFLLGAKKKLFHRFPTGGYIKELNFLESDYVWFDEEKHNVINNLNLLEKIGIDWKDFYQNREDIRYILKLPNESREFWKRYIANLDIGDKRIIGIHPGSTDSEAAIMRRWWYENYFALTKELINRGNIVLIFWWKDEISEIDNLKKLSEWLDWVYFIEENFRNCLWILNSLDILVCNDNGFGHIASGLWIPIITLWWSTNPNWSLPWGDHVRLIKKASFVPWYRYELKRRIPKWAKSGMKEIKVEDVLKELNL